MAGPFIPPMAASVNRFREAAGIQDARIFDSCSDKDCLEDLQVFFSDETQEIINSSVSVRARSAEVTDVTCTVEPLRFRTGFYTVETTYFFRIYFSAQPSSGAAVEVTGSSYHQKSCILFGGEGGVKTFTSAGSVNPPTMNPLSSVQVSEPVVLSSSLIENCPAYIECPDSLPAVVTEHFADICISPLQEDYKVVVVTLGVFSVISLMREVQMLIPVYDYVIPERDCSSNPITEDPCEIFRNLRFPVDQFYPNSPGNPRNVFR